MTCSLSRKQTFCLLASAGLLAVTCRGRSLGEGPEGVILPVGGTTVRMQLGLKDKAPTPWDGSVRLSQGEVMGIESLIPGTGTAKKNAWKLSTRERKGRGARSVHDPKPGKFVRPVLLATFDGPQSATASVRTAQGDFSFVLEELVPGIPRQFLEGRVRLLRMPTSMRLTTGPDDEDWPATATATDGGIWMAYTAYRHAKPLDPKALHENRKFDVLRSKGIGDQIHLVQLDGKRFGKPQPVTPPECDVWRPSVAVDRSGTVWIVWSQKLDDNWDLYARSYEPASDRWSATLRVTRAAGADVDPAAVADPRGDRIFVAWQGWREGSFDIVMTSLSSEGAAKERRLSTSPANEWWPAAAVDSKGSLFVAYDTYAAGNYDVKLACGAEGLEPKTVDVAVSPFFEVRPSIGVDHLDRVWVAYEEGGQSWGKDTGMKWVGRRGEQLYWRREIVLRAVEGGTVRQAPGPVPSKPISRNYPDATTRRLSGPRLAIGPGGRVWLAFRRHPLNSGGGEIWSSFLTYHEGDTWAEPVRLARSENLMDNRPALLPRDDGSLLLVHSTDGRTRGTQSAKQNDLVATIARADAEPKSPSLGDLPPAPSPGVVVHPNETDDIRRLRDYRATIGGKRYQLLRGEFHRHTELTSHRDQDGTLQDMWRYGIDAAGMDWIGNGDHDNGYGVEYLWWLVQKQTDMYHHPPFFMPMFTYERSVVYPSGHRNALFATRGIRPLPRIPGGQGPLFGTPEEGSPDIKTFYAYLKHFDGICASHTCATNMGTDWRDHDPGVEPIVEIFQGLRQSYEHTGAPGTTADAEDSIGGYRPAGYVWNALMKGYRLGFQSSSDHYSSHISYAVVWAEETSREGILEAFKKRHSYAANDNIILDVRSGEHMMGDAFAIDGKPELSIKVVGTAPIARLSIIRGVAGDSPRYVYDSQPNRQEIDLTWSDEQPERGQTNYYYVRVEQEPPENGYGALAWASPMWIEVKK